MATSALPGSQARVREDNGKVGAHTGLSAKSQTSASVERDNSVRIKRLSINLTEKSYDRLLGLQRETEALHVTDTVREALRVYDILVSEALKGKRITISSPDNPGEIEVMRLI